MRRFVIVLLVLVPPAEAMAQYNPYAPQQAVDPRLKRAWREQAVAYVASAGGDARALVETEGDEATIAILSCSPPVARKLSEFHKSGALDKLPRPRDLLRAIGQPGCGDDVTLWAIQHQSELTDTDNLGAYCLDPLQYALGLKGLAEGGAEARARRLAAQATVTPAPQQQPQPQVPQLPLDNRALALGGGALLVLVLLFWWKRRQASGGIGV